LDHPTPEIDKLYGVFLVNGVSCPSNIYLLYYLRRFNRYPKYDGITPESVDIITEQDRDLANQVAARMGKAVWDSMVGHNIEGIEQLDLLRMTEADWQECTNGLRYTLSDLFRPGIGIARLTKALHRKRPTLIPICDSVLLQALKIDTSNRIEAVLGCMAMLRTLAQQYPGNLPALAKLKELSRDCRMELSELRIFEILHWIEFGPFKPNTQDVARYTSGLNSVQT